MIVAQGQDARSLAWARPARTVRNPGITAHTVQLLCGAPLFSPSLHMRAPLTINHQLRTIDSFPRLCFA